MRSYGKEYIIAFLICEFLMIAVFCMLDLLLFYVFFESVLIPMFIIIGVWGSRQRKIKAAYQFFLYTLLGSLFMLLAILLILFQTGTADLQILLTTEFSERRQIFLWIAFFASFAVKVPMVPVHIWLPEAHVEAPTAGSVILAGILLKLGTYGFLRFSIPMFPEATLCFTPFIYTLSAIAIIYTFLTTLRQIDLKKIIAYSSVAHMNLVTIGMFSLNIQGNWR
uniref:NADH-ubiquinone oxidoreductase chain 4 n=1 Tax=Lotus japonicus TaxID=34305 RepID=I3SMN1_LOTJA|nr:unknown [Lotus japonicus]